MLKPVVIPTRYVAVTDVAYKTYTFLGVSALFCCTPEVPMAKLVLKKEPRKKTSQ